MVDSLCDKNERQVKGNTNGKISLTHVSIGMFKRRHRKTCRCHVRELCPGMVLKLARAIMVIRVFPRIFYIIESL